MAVEWAQLFSWGPFFNEGDWQTNYWRVPFAGAPHIVASAYVNVVSLGMKDGIGGEVLVGFKRFEFFDDEGLVQETEVTEVSSILEVQRCVSITFAVDLRAAFAEAGWTVHFLS